MLHLYRGQSPSMGFAIESLWNFEVYRMRPVWDLWKPKRKQLQVSLRASVVNGVATTQPMGGLAGGFLPGMTDDGSGGVDVGSWLDRQCWCWLKQLLGFERTSENFVSPLSCLHFRGCCLSGAWSIFVLLILVPVVLWLCRGQMVKSPHRLD